MQLRNAKYQEEMRNGNDVELHIFAMDSTAHFQRNGLLGDRA